MGPTPEVLLVGGCDKDSDSGLLACGAPPPPRGPSCSWALESHPGRGLASCLCSSTELGLISVSLEASVDGEALCNSLKLLGD